MRKSRQELAFSRLASSATIPVYSYDYQHRTAADRTTLTDLLITSINDQVRVGFIQAKTDKLAQLLIKLFDNTANSRGGKRMTS